MAVSSEIAYMAKRAAEEFDSSMRRIAPDDIVNILYQHSVAAAATAVLAPGGVDVLLITGEVWAMYIRINNVLGVSFSENLVKSVGSAVAANLTANLGQLAVAGILKFIPGVHVIGGALMAGTVFATTMAAGWVYLNALCRMATAGSSSGDLKSIINEVMSDSTASIERIFDTEKGNYKK